MAWAHVESAVTALTFNQTYPVPLADVDDGDLIVVGWGCGDPISSIADTLGLTWVSISAAEEAAPAAGLRGAMWYAIVGTGQGNPAGTTITVTAASGFVGTAMASRFAATLGDVWSAPLVTANGASANGTTPNSGNATADANDQLAVGVVCSATGSPPNPGTGWTSGAVRAPESFVVPSIIEYREVDNAVSVAATYGTNNGFPENWYAGVAIFEVSGGAPPSKARARRRRSSLTYR